MYPKEDRINREQRLWIASYVDNFNAALSGQNPADPVTEAAKGRAPVRYTDYLKADGLRGARLGVVRQLSNRENADAEVIAVFEQALKDLEAQGAIIIDPVDIPELSPSAADGPDTMWCPRFKADLESYLASLGPDAPYRTLQEIIDSGKFHPASGSSMRFFQGIAESPEEHEGCQRSLVNRAKFRKSVLGIMDTQDLDALIYPTWANPPLRHRSANHQERCLHQRKNR